MKCINCGHELENGSGFCENCGMILSLDGDDSYNENEAMQDVYSSASFEDDNSDFEAYFENAAEDEQQAENGEMPRELEADETEQIAYVETYDEDGENIGNGYDESADEIEESQEAFDVEEAEEEQNEESYEADEEIQEAFSSNYNDEPEDTFEDYESQDSYIEEAEQSAEENESYQSSYENNEEDEDEIYSYSQDLDDMYIEKKKNRKGTALIAVLIVILAVVVAGGVGIIKGDFKLPVVAKPDETQVDVSKSNEDETDTKETSEKETVADETTDEETTTAQAEKETSQKETEKETSKSNIVTESSKPSATKPSSTAPTTTKPSTTKPSSTAPTTTKPSATKPTTTKPSTTKPTTTKPSTTKESETAVVSTTSKYSITDAKVQLPSKYLTNAFTVYMKENGIVLRSKPTSDSERVLYLSYGDDLKVLASEDGFYYVRSNRYGVYGWVKQSYVSKERPQSQTTADVPNLVEPDKKYSKVETKYVNTYDGLRLRKGPGTNYDVIRFLSNGYPLKVVGYSTKVSGWVYVTDTTHGVSGWVASAYIK